MDAILWWKQRTHSFWFEKSWLSINSWSSYDLLLRRFNERISRCKSPFDSPRFTQSMGQSKFYYIFGVLQTVACRRYFCRIKRITINSVISKYSLANSCATILLWSQCFTWWIYWRSVQSQAKQKTLRFSFSNHLWKSEYDDSIRRLMSCFRGIRSQRIK